MCLADVVFGLSERCFGISGSSFGVERFHVAGFSFGAAVATQVGAILEATAGREIVELGAGSGRLAVDLLRELDRLGAPVASYRIVETSPDLQARQREAIARELPAWRNRVAWLDAGSCSRTAHLSIRCCPQPQGSASPAKAITRARSTSPPRRWSRMPHPIRNAAWDA